MKRNSHIRFTTRLKNIVMLFGAIFILCQCNTQTAKKELELEHKQDECCSDRSESSITKSETSEITCPECGHKETEELPTEVCQIKYTCKKCNAELTPNEEDCCVFCTYGTHKCPSMQDE